MTPSPLHHPFSIHTRETHSLLLPSPNLGWGTHPCFSLGRAALWKVSDSGFGGSDYFLRGSWRSVDKSQASCKDFRELLSKAGRLQQGALPWGLCAGDIYSALLCLGRRSCTFHSQDRAALLPLMGKTSPSLSNPCPPKSVQKANSIKIAPFLRSVL